jgi:hypothetical protein
MDGSMTIAADQMARRSRQSLDCVIALLLAAASVNNFVHHSPTAFEWPGTDMAPFYERQRDPKFLPNDYYTNSISQPNPRLVFGYSIVGLAHFFHIDWYSVYFALRVVMTLTVPVLWYLSLVGMVEPALRDDRQRWIARIALGVAIVLVMRRSVSNWFSIAWWPPFLIYVGAHPVSQWLWLLGIVMRDGLNKWAKHLSLAVWFAATLCHPAIGLFMFVFYWLIVFDRSRWRDLVVTGLISVVVPFVILAALFRVDAPLSAKEFIDFYVFAQHPFHYEVAQFATLTKYPWWVSFSLILGLMGVARIIGAARNDQQLKTWAIRFSAAYGGCVVLQYIGIDLLPIKLIAIIGPSRFSALGYYLLAVLAARVSCDLWPERWKWPEVPSRYRWISRARFHPWHVGVLMAASAIALYGLSKDDLQHQVRGLYAGFYDWVEHNTAPDAVFHPTFNQPLHQHLPTIGRRAVLASQSFPFREDAVREHCRHMSLGYGTLEQLSHVAGADQIVRRTNFFRSLGPTEIVLIADQVRLDYVVVERDYQSTFVGFEPCYEDASVAVYDVGTLRNGRKSSGISSQWQHF